MSKTVVIVNSSAGTAMSMGHSALKDVLTEHLGRYDPEIVNADAFGDCMRDAFQRDDADTVIIGGGDGSVSSAGRLALKHDKRLGILPLGTMNLFARALRMPPDVTNAARALSDPVEHSVDVGFINDTPFLNHVSLGLHPRLIRVRDRLPRTGRLTKIANGIRAFPRVLLRPRRIPYRMSGSIETDALRASLIFVAINPIPARTGQLPFNPGQDAGHLGIYVSHQGRIRDLAALAVRLSAGHWNDRSHMDFNEADAFQLKTARSCHISIDGEVSASDGPFDFRIAPGALKVLVPRHGA